MPGRIHKRWSARLRTAGASLLLLGAVAAFDVPLWGAAFALSGLLLYVLGRRWM